MTPSKKQIELSKCLWELGERKSIQDSWVIDTNNKDELFIFTGALSGSMKLIPIWTLEDGLEWLEEQGITSVYFEKEQGWHTFDYSYLSKRHHTHGRTRTEAVLSACVKVKSNE